MVLTFKFGSAKFQAVDLGFDKFIYVVGNKNIIITHKIYVHLKLVWVLTNLLASLLDLKNDNYNRWFVTFFFIIFGEGE